MGELIQIRVTARIHDNIEAFNRWPALIKLAFGPVQEKVFKERDLLTELVEALHDKQRIRDIPAETASKISEGIIAVSSLLKKMHSFLADRKPSDADKVSYQLEDLLDRMEQSIDGQ